MLFCNIDHLETRVLPLTRKAGHRFFVGAASLDLMFAHMELGATSEVQEPEVRREAATAAQHASDAATRLVESAELFRDLALAVEREFPDINNEIKDKGPSLVEDVARHIGISPDSPFATEMIDSLLQDKVEGVLRRLAIDISEVAARIRTLEVGFLKQEKIVDRSYEEAHAILGDWRALMIRGQFLSVICYLSSRIAA